MLSKEGAKSFPPKLNWKMLANCVDKYLNSQTETIESELPTWKFGYGKYGKWPIGNTNKQGLLNLVIFA